MLLTATRSPTLRFAFVAVGPTTATSDSLPPGTDRLLALVARLPRLVAALDGTRCFVELLADTELPPLIAAHGLARLLVEEHAVACRRPGAPHDASSLALGSGDLRELAASPSSSSGHVPARATAATAGATAAPAVAAPRQPVRSLESEVLACAATVDSRRWVSMDLERKKRSTSILVRRPASARLRTMRAG